MSTQVQETPFSYLTLESASLLETQLSASGLARIGSQTADPSRPASAPLQPGNPAEAVSPRHTDAQCPLLILKNWLSLENIALFVVCVADLVSTLYFVHMGLAVEDNPIFAAWLEKGYGPFIAMKFLSFMPLIAVSTYYRQSRPRLIKWSMRATVLTYVLLYVGRYLMQLFWGL